jgi:HPt (histidine-containing phosphotransfer) domain-containing protein
MMGDHEHSAVEADGESTRPARTWQPDPASRDRVPTCDDGRSGHSSAAVFDKAAALDRIDGDEDFLREIVGLFLAECPRLVEEIGDSIHRGDATGLKCSAHAMKGSLGNFGAETAYEAALRLEVIGRQGDLRGAEAAFASLVEILGRLEAALLETA